MRDGAHELRRDVHASDGGPYAGLLDGSCRVLSHGEIGSLIAATAAANLAFAHRRGTSRRVAHHGDGTAERRSH